MLTNSKPDFECIVDDVEEFGNEFQTLKAERGSSSYLSRLVWILHDVRMLYRKVYPYRDSKRYGERATVLMEAIIEVYYYVKEDPLCPAAPLPVGEGDESLGNVDLGFDKKAVEAVPNTNSGTTTNAGATNTQ